jgi:hypothetical protein
LSGHCIYYCNEKPFTCSVIGGFAEYSL